MAKESTLILGNGFDLDLGIPTSYHSFAESQYWPIDNKMIFCSRLAQYLDDSAKCEHWFDLELALARYAAPIRDNKEAAISALMNSWQIDQQVFEKIRKTLSTYIAEVEKLTLRGDSLSAQVIKKTLREHSVDNIFSFNYTDLNALCAKYNVQKLDYHHVHGSCKNNSAILGISDEEKVRDGYDFLYKTCSPYYQSTNVRYALQRSSLVIFFGHSLGPQDYHYFSDFFRQQSRVDMKEADAKSIIIITRDDASRMDILKQLRRMNDGKINLLYDCNKVRFFKTAEDSNDMILDYVNEELDAVLEYNVRIKAQEWLGKKIENQKNTH